jgi:hypothetical protein
MFQHRWFHSGPYGRLPRQLFYDLIWFSLVVMPFLTIASSVILVSLYFTDPPLAWRLLHYSAYVTVVCWVYVITTGLAADPDTARRSWRSALTFPGLINLMIIFGCAFQRQAAILGHWVFMTTTGSVGWLPSTNTVMLGVYAWLAAAIPLAWAAKELERTGRARSARALLFFVGYGTVLLAVSTVAWLREYTGHDAVWAKTEKSGNVGVRHG